MKIAVVGAGIVGITTAFELTLDGHDVTVFEKNTSVAEHSSFATGGLLASSLTQPYSHTSWPKSGRLIRLLADLKHVPLRGVLNASLWKWLLQWSAVTPQEQFLEDFATACRLVTQSMERVNTICQDVKIEFEQGAGQLLLMQSGTDAKCVELKLAALKNLGIQHQVVSAGDVARVEPSLNIANTLEGAVFFPADGVGNCRQFSQLLKDRATQSGARFLFNTAVTSVRTTAGLALTLSDHSTAVQFDRIVLCTGQAVAELAAPLKIRIPGVTAHSYSLSAPMREPLNGPRNAVFDARTNVGMARIGNRIRATGGVHIGRASERAEKKAQDLLYRALQKHFPGAASMSNSTQFWRGSTLITADALPAVGESAVPGVYLNIGHGFNGWGMACAAARLLADELNCGSVAGAGLRLSPKRFRH